MGRSLQQITVATGNVDPDTATAWFKLDHSPQDKAVRIMANCTGAAGTADVRVILRLPDGTSPWGDTGTATAKAGRVGADGASGNYYMSVVFTQSGNEFVDLAGAIKASTRSAASTLSPDGVEWWVGVALLTTITSITLYAEPVTEV